MRNHYLPIESERWSGSDYNDRLCNNGIYRKLQMNFIIYLTVKNYKTSNAITYKSIIDENYKFI